MEQPELRASDADRQKVADRLKHAVDEGRLDLGEYDERLAAAYAAKTYGELTALTGDLPGPVPAAHSQLATSEDIAAEIRSSRRPSRGYRWSPWRPWATVALITTGIWFITNLGGSPGFGYFWPVWVIVPWGLVLAAGSFGPGRVCRR
ncbi:MAG: DUF1707 SHOCT-like domain-containing protein [Micromonosporaceae bacterium]